MSASDEMNGVPRVLLLFETFYAREINSRAWSALKEMGKSLWGAAGRGPTVLHGCRGSREPPRFSVSPRFPFMLLAFWKETRALEIGDGMASIKQ